jgi:hypothetical protein
MATPNDKPLGMKSAYELALERLERQGIERPREEALTEKQKAEIAELRRRTEAKLAELEILHRDRLGKIGDPAAREAEEREYRAERQRQEADRDRKIAAVRD